MNFVILTALLSSQTRVLCRNTYAVLTICRKDGKSRFRKVNERGIPMNALLITLAVAGLSLLSSVFVANTVFVWLLSLVCLGAQIGWIAITASQIAFRRSYIRQGGKVEDLKFKAPLYPVIPILGLLANCIVMASWLLIQLNV